MPFSSPRQFGVRLTIRELRITSDGLYGPNHWTPACSPLGHVCWQARHSLGPWPPSSCHPLEVDQCSDVLPNCANCKCRGLVLSDGAAWHALLHAQHMLYCNAETPEGAMDPIVDQSRSSVLEPNSVLNASSRSDTHWTARLVTGPEKQPAHRVEPRQNCPDVVQEDLPASKD